MLSNSLQGWAHFAAAAIALLLGAGQLLRPKGGNLHKKIGYAYVVAVIICDAGALGVYRFTGRFNALHVGALMNFTCVIGGIAPFYASSRPVRWRMSHAIWMCWSYVGLWAAGLTELVVRNVHWSSRCQVIGATVVTTTLVTCAGFFLVQRLRSKISALESTSATFQETSSK